MLYEVITISLVGHLFPLPTWNLTLATDTLHIEFDDNAIHDIQIDVFQSGQTRFVITSYSIHYTKLYDPE